MGRSGVGGGLPDSVLFVFLDGVGLGVADPATNPLAAAATPFLREVLAGPLTRETPEVTRPDLVYRRLDATLGVEGLPQSATGQTTLLTGVNGALAMGRHYGPWPGPTLRAVLEKGSLFTKGLELRGAVLANAYPPQYFESLGTRRHRPNAPVVAATAAGLELRDMGAYRAGLAVAADVDGARFARMDPSLTPQGAAGAAGSLIRLAASASFVFFDVWPTDALGHARDFTGATRLLEQVDLLLERVAGSGITVVVTSDHGNLEDVTSGRHTLNRVPLLVFGPGAPEFARARSLLDVAPAIERFWGLVTGP